VQSFPPPIEAASVPATEKLKFAPPKFGAQVFNIVNVTLPAASAGSAGAAKPTGAAKVASTGSGSIPTIGWAVDIMTTTSNNPSSPPPNVGNQFFFERDPSMYSFI
jgi:hypothetical protein